MELAGHQRPQTGWMRGDGAVCVCVCGCPLHLHRAATQVDTIDGLCVCLHREQCQYPFILIELVTITFSPNSCLLTGANESRLLSRVSAAYERRQTSGEVFKYSHV